MTTRTAPKEDPGKTLGILGFILSFFVSLAGLILSIIALNKSRKAGFTNGLAIAGLIISILNMVVGTGILFAITAVSYNGVTARANTVSAQAAANGTIKWAEAYRLDKGDYPVNAAQLKEETLGAEPTIVFSNEPITAEPVEPQTIAFYNCDGGGNKVEYWDYQNSLSTAMYVGSATSQSTCVIVK